MILSVNKDELVGADYDTATATLRKTEGVINMWVANATRIPGAVKGWCVVWWCSVVVGWVVVSR